MSLMIRAATRTAAHTAAAPLALLLRSAALRLSSLRSSSVPLLHRSSIRSPPLAVAFSASASSARSLPLHRRVSSVSGSAAAAASAPSASATPRVDCSQSAGQSRSFSSKQVGSSVVTPSAAASSSSLVVRRSAHSPTGLRSAHFSAAPFVHAARKQTGVRLFSSQSLDYLRGVSETRMQIAMKRLTLTKSFAGDPLVSALSDCLQQLEVIRTRTPACDETSAEEMDWLLLRLADVALWMPITREARTQWLADPSRRPFLRSTVNRDSARVVAAMLRLRKVHPSDRHPLAGSLLLCMQQLDLANRSFVLRSLWRATRRRRGRARGVSRDWRLTPRCSLVRTAVRVPLQFVQLFVMEFAESLALSRQHRWIAKDEEAAPLMESDSIAQPDEKDADSSSAALAPSSEFRSSLEDLFAAQRQQNHNLNLVFGALQLANARLRSTQAEVDRFKRQRYLYGLAATIAAMSKLMWDAWDEAAPSDLTNVAEGQAVIF